ncbi:MAG: hypothetical protein HYX75_17765 [Acidobacteria bacterium]|nr:hypothetical protein [Acidobacteriota bacterium]
MKAKERLHERDFRSVRTVARMPGLLRRLVVFLGDRPFRTEDGIEGVPIEQFISMLEQRRI